MADNAHEEEEEDLPDMDRRELAEAEAEAETEAALALELGDGGWDRSLRKATSPFFWVLEERLRYRTKHRAQDLALLCQLWTIPESRTAGGGNNSKKAKASRHYEDTNAKVKKKYKRAVDANASKWFRMSEEMEPLFEANNGLSLGEASARIIDACTRVLDDIDAALPTFESSHLVDVTHGTAREDGASAWSDTTITILEFWMLYRRASARSQLRDCEGVIRDADDALALFPPLEEGNVPHPYEVVLRCDRANAALQLPDNPDVVSALADLRCCGAAIRLHMYDDKVAGPGAVKFLTDKVGDGVIPSVARVAVKIKVRAKAARPYFTVDELNDLEKELGIGIYSQSEYKCGECGVDRNEAKLVQCLGCKRKWYCGRECQLAHWTTHKKACKNDKWRNARAVRMESRQIEHMKEQARQDTVQVTSCLMKDMLSVWCVDEETGELFDGLTDATCQSK